MTVRERAAHSLAAKVNVVSDFVLNVIESNVSGNYQKALIPRTRTFIQVFACTVSGRRQLLVSFSFSFAPFSFCC